MKQHRHRIHREKAIDMIEKFKTYKTGNNGRFDDIPEGFQFDADQVRDLLKHPDAAYFVIRMGWKKDDLTGKEILSPVLCVCDEDYRVIEEEDLLSEEPLGQEQMKGYSFAGTDLAEDVVVMAVRAGGYLDESKPIPPPPIQDTPR